MAEEQTIKEFLEVLSSREPVPWQAPWGPPWA